MNKYKLVVFGNDWDVYQVAYKELIDNPHIIYIPTFRPKGLAGLLQRIQFNPKLNSIVAMPGKHLWNPYYVRGINDSRLCFFLQENWLRMECGIRLLPYLRSTYPQAKIVCFTQDIIETIRDFYSHRPLDVDYLKRYTDLLISYDRLDAQKYGILYHPTFYSGIECTAEQPQYDLFFLGRDKGRLPLLIRLSQEAERRNLKCKFLLIEVPKEERIVCPGITYIDSELSYSQNLELCSKSKCIVEILQHDASSPTFRTWEAIALNRRLLTNNVSLTQSEIYDKRYISTFRSISDIDWEFITGDQPFTEGKNPYEDKMKPEGMIRFIEEQLKITIDR